MKVKVVIKKLLSMKRVAQKIKREEQNLATEPWKNKTKLVKFDNTDLKTNVSGTCSVS